MPKVPKHTWKDENVVVKVGDKSTKTVAARVLGELAVHPGVCPKHSGRWVVALLHSSLVVTSLRKEVHAVEVAEALWKELKNIWERRDPDEILSLLPGWVGGWCRAMSRNGDKMSPVPHMRKYHAANR